MVLKISTCHSNSVFCVCAQLYSVDFVVFCCTVFTMISWALGHYTHECLLMSSCCCVLRTCSFPLCAIYTLSSVAYIHILQLFARVIKFHWHAIFPILIHSTDHSWAVKITATVSYCFMTTPSNSYTEGTKVMINLMYVCPCVVV